MLPSVACSGMEVCQLVLRMKNECDRKLLYVMFEETYNADIYSGDWAAVLWNDKAVVKV